MANLHSRMTYIKATRSQTNKSRKNALKGDKKYGVNKYKDSTSSSGRDSPKWKDICYAARLR